MIRYYISMLIILNTLNASIAQETDLTETYHSITDTFKVRYSRSDSLRGALSPLREAIDVQYYHIDLTLDIANKRIDGYTDITFKCVLVSPRFQLDLFKNMHIDSIVYNNNQLSFEREEDAFFVTMPENMTKGKKYTLRVWYSGKPLEAKRPPWDGGFIWSKTPSGKPWIAVACQGLGASSWFPCKDHLSDEPDEGAQITLHVPDTLMAISNGRLVKHLNDNDGHATFSWQVQSPINNYNITFYITDYAHFSDLYFNGKDTLTLDYYVLPEHVEKALVHFQQVHKTLQAFEHYFGKYPFYRDGYKLVEAPYLGMEHQSAIAYGNRFLPGYLGNHLPGIDFDYIIVHETAHEWWGNHLSMKDIADMWLHEGFGTYSEVLFVEYYYGKEAALKYLNHLKKRITNDLPIIGDYDVNKEGSPDMYNKGALVLHTLRSWVNDDEKFINMLRALQQTFSLQTVSTIQVENFIAKYLNMKLRPFFNQYLRNADLPVLDYYFTGTGKSKMLFYKWSAVPDFQMPVRVMLEKDQWTTLYPGILWQSIPAPIKQKWFRFDKDHFYFDTSEK